MIDSHHHLWEYSVAEYPWIPAGSPLAQSYGIAELEASTAAAGVDGTVVVQARQSLVENDCLLSLADQSELIAGVVGWAPLIEENVGEVLGRLAAHPKFKGVRHVLEDEPDSYFLRDDFHRGLALLPDLDLRYDLLVFQRQLPVAVELVDRQPDLGIVIDHLAKPEIHNGRIDSFWKSHMAELAKREHVLGVKVSGMTREVRDGEIDVLSLRAYFYEALELFGADRLMFGTDWPVSLLRGTTCADWAEMVRGFVEDLSEDEQDAILHGNAVRCYGL